MHRKITDYLLDWKKKSNSKPLIVRGARQVGKTYSVLRFGEDYFENLVYLNLDHTEQKDLFSKVESVKEFIELASVFTKTKIQSKNTLIFIDEIQNAPNLVHLLRFFYEESPQYNVIAAGSLFENYLVKEKISMPVGRVEYAYMYPLDFFEFLQALGHTSLVDTLKNVLLEQPLSQSIHELALDYFYKYLMIGGLPEVVEKYRRGVDLVEIEKTFDNLFESYLDDVDKYASLAQRNYIKYVFKLSPLYSGQNYNYTNFGGGTYSSVEISHSFRQLESSMLVNEVLGTNSSKIPLFGQRKRAKKMIFLDVGLANYKSFGSIIDFSKKQDLSDIFNGRVAEQFVGQSLLNLYQYKKHNILYWTRSKDRASAEIDFTFLYKGKICGIEVKSGSTGKLKSLYSFSENVKNSCLIRVHSGELKKENVVYHDKKYEFYSMPFYLMPRILDFVE